MDISMVIELVTHITLIYALIYASGKLLISIDTDTPPGLHGFTTQSTPTPDNQNKTTPSAETNPPQNK